VHSKRRGAHVATQFRKKMRANDCATTTFAPAPRALPSIRAKPSLQTTPSS